MVSFSDSKAEHARQEQSCFDFEKKEIIKIRDSVTYVQNPLNCV